MSCTIAKYENNKLCSIVIGKWEFTIEHFMSMDHKDTDRYCVFGPHPAHGLPQDDYDERLEIALRYACVMDWQFGEYSDGQLDYLSTLLSDKLIKFGLDW